MTAFLLFYQIKKFITTTALVPRLQIHLLLSPANLSAKSLPILYCSLWGFFTLC